MMHYRRLGDTGVVVSELGLGGGGIGQVWGPTTDDAAVAAVDAALAAGVNFFDVAPRYGDGRAERVLGRALEHRREEALIASKVYLGPETLDDISGAIERGLAESLERLGSDRLDLFNCTITSPGSAARCASRYRWGTCWGRAAWWRRCSG